MDSLTLIRWYKGNHPNDEGRYLVHLYSGAIDTDYFEYCSEWEKYDTKEIVRYCKLSDVEDELNIDPLEKYKVSMGKFSQCMENASMALREYNKEVSKINLEEEKLTLI